LNKQKTRCVLTIDAEYDARTPARILALLTRGDALPDRFAMVVIDDHAIRVVMELRCSDSEATDVLARRIANIPSVKGVSRVHSRIAAERPLPFFAGFGEPVTAVGQTETRRKILKASPAHVAASQSV